MEPAANLAALPELYRYRQVGTDVVSINIGYGRYSLDNHFLIVRQIRQWLSERSDDFAVVATADDIRAAKARGALAVVFDIEGAGVMEQDIAIVAEFAALGVRWIAMAYNENNGFAGGCHDDDPGLSDMGRNLVDAMFAVGITPCCSHTGFETALAVIDYADQPVLFSHSNAQSLHRHPRNIPDELIRRCAAKGGVIGINGVNVFLGDPTSPSVDTLAEHVDHIVQIAGCDNVSLALDSSIGCSTELDQMSSSPLFPVGHGYDSIDILDPEAIPAIVETLSRRGYSDSEMDKIFGLNLLRIAETNWIRAA
jgi:membrane dipeptidase